uniref:Uncharacterized protein n=1 Tax=Cacopsylla melanoneura TaxID=428564 RepID=A0A8D8VQ50_9HEMI
MTSSPRFSSSFSLNTFITCTRQSSSLSGLSGASGTPRTNKHILRLYCSAASRRSSTSPSRLSNSDCLLSRSACRFSMAPMEVLTFPISSITTLWKIWNALSRIVRELVIWGSLSVDLTSAKLVWNSLSLASISFNLLRSMVLYTL